MHWKSLGWPVKVTTPSWNAKLLPSILSPIGYTKSPTIAGLTMDLQYGPWSNHREIKQYLHGLTGYLYGRCFPEQRALTPGMIIPMDASASNKIQFGQSQGFSNIWRIFINYISNSSKNIYIFIYLTMNIDYLLTEHMRLFYSCVSLTSRPLLIQWLALPCWTTFYWGYICLYPEPIFFK